MNAIDKENQPADCLNKDAKKTEFWRMYNEGTILFKATCNLLFIAFAMTGLTMSSYWVYVLFLIIKVLRS